MSTMGSRQGNAATILITGAAGGLGRALVQAFGGAGWQVAAGIHRNQPDPADWPAGTWPLPLDVTDVGQVEAAFRSIRDRWGKLDALVHCAGCTADGPLLRLAEADWDRVLATNLDGAARCARAAARLFDPETGGHVIFIGSHSGRHGRRGQAAYAAAKAGLLGLAPSLAREWGPRNIRVNVVLPGLLETPMVQGMEPGARQEQLEAHVLGRLSTVEETARCIVFLTSLRHVSGQVFQLDSRLSAWI